MRHSLAAHKHSHTTQSVFRSTRELMNLFLIVSITRGEDCNVLSDIYSGRAEV